MKCEKCINFNLDIYECEKNTAPLSNGKGVLFCLKFIKRFESGCVHEGFYPVGFRLEAKRKA